jgi:hypothetical protein
MIQDKVGRGDMFLVKVPATTKEATVAEDLQHLYNLISTEKSRNDMISPRKSFEKKYKNDSIRGTGRAAVENKKSVQFFFVLLRYIENCLPKANASAANSRSLKSSRN